MHIQSYNIETVIHVLVELLWLLVRDTNTNINKPGRSSHPASTLRPRLNSQLRVIRRIDSILEIW